MKRWNNESVGDANLNATFAPDAVVDSSVTASGAIYATLQAALAAGHKNILVRPGSGYSGTVTITTAGARIVGSERPVYSGSTFTGGAVFTGSSIEIAADCVTLENIAVNISSGTAFWTNGYSHASIIGCGVGSGGSTCVTLRNGFGWKVENCVLVCDSSQASGHGILLAAGSATANAYGFQIRDNWIQGFAGNGILAQSTGTSDTAPLRGGLIEGNTVQNCARGWGYGIGADAHNSLQIIGNDVFYCGDADTDASGIRVATLGTSPTRGVVVMGNKCFENTGYGIDLATAQAAVSVAGNMCWGNGVGQYRNCGSSPGYTWAACGSNVAL